MTQTLQCCDQIVMVIGSGGREHAIAAKLDASPRVARVLVAPGNGGTALESGSVSNVPDLDVSDFQAVSDFCRSHKVNLVVVGPEKPLADGIVDALSAQGIPTFGPCQEAAKIEASKTFSKTLMKKLGIPTARFECFSDFESARRHVESVDYPVVIKASGLAAGKGVILPDTIDEAVDALRSFMLDRCFGVSGAEVVVEERLEGEEVSVLAFSDGHSIALLPAAQDHKRLLDGDAGPNTGGMGAYAPAPVATQHVIDTVVNTIIQPTIDGMRRSGTPYVGVLYAGVILTRTGPQCLEFNCRLGDPEAQVCLPLLKTDLFELVSSCVRGCLDSVPLEVRSGAAATVVLASGGYPKVYKKGIPITLPENLDTETDLFVFHAGTVLRRGELLTNGGRVLAVTAVATDIEGAIARAYEGVALTTFENSQFRRDIGHRALSFRSKADDAAATMYAKSGVNIAEGNRAVALMKSAVESTYGTRVLSGLGSFGGLYDANDLKSMKSPVLVASSDGVGTKIKLASALKIYNTIGRDIVNHCVNDILVQGAEPMFFLDYVAASKIDPEMVSNVVLGAAEACKEVGCALLGGETAEMPGVYETGEFDLAGTIVGCVERDQLIDGSRIAVGDAVVAFRSAGLHTNGFSLARSIFADFDMSLSRPELDGRCLGSVLLEPHRAYLNEYRTMRSAGIDVHGLAHITGGGLVENPPRILGGDVACRVELSSWRVPPIFELLQRVGQVPLAEMRQVFNMGLGMLVFVPASQAQRLVDLIGSELAVIVGSVVPRVFGSTAVQFVGDHDMGAMQETTAVAPRTAEPLNDGIPSRKRMSPIRIGVLGSTRGTDLQPILESIHLDTCPASIEVVISNRRSAFILERARRHRIPHRFVSAKGRDREQFDAEITRILHEHRVDLVLLIGYMRIVSTSFVDAWRGRLLNVHPSLLPAFGGGMDCSVHEAVLSSGVKQSGCSVHHVTEAVDGGDLVVQKRCAVLDGDSAETLKQRVQKLEGFALLEAIRAYANDTLRSWPQHTQSS